MDPQLIEVSSAFVRARLREKLRGGFHVDPRLQTEIDKPGKLYLLPLKTQSDFLSLIWQARDDSRLLTPANEPRALLDVASRLIRSGYTFEQLANDLGLPKKQHNPAWFKPCVNIDREFSFEKFDWVVLTPANECELQETPAGTHYIFDGVHKTLVLAKRLLAQQETYRPLEALLLTPRRS